MANTRIVICAAAVCALGASAAQAEPRITQSSQEGTFQYARLGGTAVAHGPGVAPGMTLLGYRGEIGRLAIDVSGLSFAFATRDQDRAGALAWSLVKLEVLRFVHDEGDGSAYAGGGASLGGVEIEERGLPGPDGCRWPWSGSGLQGEVTVGYEWARTSPVRMFLQADLGLPFYRLRSHVTSAGGRLVSDGSVYAPSVGISFGLAWRHGGHRRP